MCFDLDSRPPIEPIAGGAIDSEEIILRASADGSAIVRVTASVAALMTLTLAPCLLVTQTAPSGAIARLRGAAPTAISATRSRAVLSNTETLSLSALTTQTRAKLPRDS